MTQTQAPTRWRITFREFDQVPDSPVREVVGVFTDDRGAAGQPGFQPVGGEMLYLFPNEILTKEEAPATGCPRRNHGRHPLRRLRPGVVSRRRGLGFRLATRARRSRRRDRIPPSPRPEHKQEGGAMTKTLDGRERWSTTERDLAELGTAAAYGIALENGATINRYQSIKARAASATRRRMAR